MDDRSHFKQLKINVSYYYPMGWVDEIVIKSEIRYCGEEGPECLHKYIDTRNNQPMCTNCLRWLGVLGNYKPIYRLGRKDYTHTEEYIIKKQLV